MVTPDAIKRDLEELDEIHRRAARERFLPFVTYSMPTFEINWHHRVMAQYLEDFAFGKIKRLILNAPPRTGKTELAGRRLPAFLLGINPDLHIIGASYADALAARTNRDIQRIIESETYNRVFPGTQLWGKNVRNTAQGSFLRNSDIFEIVGRSGSYRSAGIGSGITGMGMHRGIIDDPVKDRAEANSPTVMKSQWDWYTNVFMTRMEGDDAGILINMTRWGDDDIAGRAIELAKNDPTLPQWTVVTFPAIRDDEDDETPYTDPREIGDPLWPSKFGTEYYREMSLSMSPQDYYAVYQQRPRKGEGDMLKAHWWKFWTSLPALESVITSWDMAFKGSIGSAYVVGQVWGRAGGNYYLIDQVRQQMDFVNTKRAFRNLVGMYPNATKHVVEDKANGPAIISELKNEISGIVEYTPEGSKEARASAYIQPALEAGNIFIPEPTRCPWVIGFIQRNAAFPNGKYKDETDAMSQGIHVLRKNRTRLVSPSSSSSISRWAAAG